MTGKLAKIDQSIKELALATTAKGAKELALIKTAEQATAFSLRHKTVADYLRRAGATDEEVDSVSKLSILAKQKAGALLSEYKIDPGGRGRNQHSTSTNSKAKSEYNKLLRDTNTSYSDARRMKMYATVDEKQTQKIFDDLQKSGRRITENAFLKGVRHSNPDAPDSNSWYTPTEEIALAKRVLGKIDLDPASCEFAQKVVKARAYFTAEDDGLTQQWHGRVFCNPPYSSPLVGKFATKLIEEYKSGRVTEAILLVGDFTESAWFHDLAARAVFCIRRGRISFYRPGDSAASSPMRGTVYFYLGKDPSGFVQEYSQIGTICSRFFVSQQKGTL